ncbi:transposase [Devosia sp. UYZn731]
MQITTVRLDLAKRVFQVHAVDVSGDVVVRKALRRSQVELLPVLRTPS